MKAMSDNMIVAKTILEQLGGSQFRTMTGAKNFIAGPNTLSFRIGRNCKQVNYVLVTLTAQDTYNIKFERVCRIKKAPHILRFIIAEKLGIYCDQLRPIFEEATGMRTKLF